MVTQYKMTCNECNGVGVYINYHEHCSQCQGTRLIPTKVLREIIIQPGMIEGTKITFKEDGEILSPDEQPGDLIFIIQQKDNPYFSRKGDSLHVKKIINLGEALGGFSFPLVHLDGRNLLIRTEVGEIMKPGDIKCIPNEGMPVYGSSVKGNLYIHFEIEFPQKGTLNDSQLKLLLNLFPPREPIIPDNQAFTLFYTLQDVKNEKSFTSTTKRKAQGNIYDDDKDINGCAQQ